MNDAMKQLFEVIPDEFMEYYRRERFVSLSDRALLASKDYIQFLEEENKLLRERLKEAEFAVGDVLDHV